ncbi:MAG: hypothetical protein IJP25_01990 [Elusimicrobiaceae bacterium]|nr:hypothetical protein [Elusimicrobiaceae bacterium]
MSDLFSTVAKELKNTFDKNFFERAKYMPSAKETVEIFSALKDFLYQYPLVCNNSSCATPLEILAVRLEKEIKNSFCFFCEEKTDCHSCERRAKEITEKFFQTLPSIQRLLMTDVQAAYEGDPAAVTPAETLLCYPGVTAIAYQRMAHFLYKEGVKLIPRIVTEYAHSLTGIDIHPGAQIGPSFFIDHGTGVVIGETCVIGAHVKLYQGVTLGAKSFPLDENGNPVKGIKRHPNLQDRVIIYAESTVLGNVTIGENSVIGANKWITEDIPPNSKI